MLKEDGHDASLRPSRYITQTPLIRDVLKELELVTIQTQKMKAYESKKSKKSNE